MSNGNIAMPSSVHDLRARFLRDVRLAAIARGITNPPIHPGTDWYVLGTGLGNIGLIHYYGVRQAEKNMDVLGATGERLDRIREADGLPVAQPSSGAGKVEAGVVAGAITVQNGLQFKFPNGLLGKAAGQHLGVTNGSLVSVIAIDTGKDTNLAAGGKIEWVSPPLNLESEAEVSVSNPITGGLDEETDERKRDRILNKRRHAPAGGNPGDNIAVGLDALATAQYCFVYPAPGGPSSSKLCVVKDIDPEKNDWSRVMLEGGRQIIRTALQADLPPDTARYVCTADEEGADVALNATIPKATAAGGNGTGWTDATVWPNLVGADNGRVTITVSASGNITVSANTTVSPIQGQTHIAWWSPVDMKFYTALIISVAGGAGAWELSPDTPLVDSQNDPAAVDDFICPAATNIEAYGKTWRTTMRRMGPGEMTDDANRLPRSLRLPFVEEEWHSELGFKQLDTLTAAHSEMTNVEYGHRSISTPTVPATVDDNPNILVPRHFGVYQA